MTTPITIEIERIDLELFVVGDSDEEEDPVNTSRQGSGVEAEILGLIKDAELRENLGEAVKNVATEAVTAAASAVSEASPASPSSSTTNTQESHANIVHKIIDGLKVDIGRVVVRLARWAVVELSGLSLQQCDRDWGCDPSSSKSLADLRHSGRAGTEEGADLFVFKLLRMSIAVSLLVADEFGSESRLLELLPATAIEVRLTARKLHRVHSVVSLETCVLLKNLRLGVTPALVGALGSLSARIDRFLSGAKARVARAVGAVQDLLGEETVERVKDVAHDVRDAVTSHLASANRMYVLDLEVRGIANLAEPLSPCTVRFAVASGTLPGTPIPPLSLFTRTAVTSSALSELKSVRFGSGDRAPHVLLQLGAKFSARSHVLFAQICGPSGQVSEIAAVQLDPESLPAMIDVGRACVMVSATVHDWSTRSAPRHRNLLNIFVERADLVLSLPGTATAPGSSLTAVATGIQLSHLVDPIHLGDTTHIDTVFGSLHDLSVVHESPTKREVLAGSGTSGPATAAAQPAPSSSSVSRQHARVVVPPCFLAETDFHFAGGGVVEVTRETRYSVLGPVLAILCGDQPQSPSAPAPASKKAKRETDLAQVRLETTRSVIEHRKTLNRSISATITPFHLTLSVDALLFLQRLFSGASAPTTTTTTTTTTLATLATPSPSLEVAIIVDDATLRVVSGDIVVAARARDLQVFVGPLGELAAPPFGRVAAGDAEVASLMDFRPHCVPVFVGGTLSATCRRGEFYADERLLLLADLSVRGHSDRAVTNAFSLHVSSPAVELFLSPRVLEAAISALQDVKTSLDGLLPGKSAPPAPDVNDEVIRRDPGPGALTVKNAICVTFPSVALVIRAEGKSDKPGVQVRVHDFSAFSSFGGPKDEPIFAKAVLDAVFFEWGDELVAEAVPPFFTLLFANQKLSLGLGDLTVHPLAFSAAFSEALRDIADNKGKGKAKALATANANASASKSAADAPPSPSPSPREATGHFPASLSSMLDLESFRGLGETLREAKLSLARGSAEAAVALIEAASSVAHQNLRDLGTIHDTAANARVERLVAENQALLERVACLSHELETVKEARAAEAAEVAATTAPLATVRKLRLRVRELTTFRDRSLRWMLLQRGVDCIELEANFKTKAVRVGMEVRQGKHWLLLQSGRNKIEIVSDAILAVHFGRLPHQEDEDAPSHLPYLSFSLELRLDKKKPKVVTERFLMGLSEESAKTLVLGLSEAVSRDRPFDLLTEGKLLWKRARLRLKFQTEAEGLTASQILVRALREK